MRSEKYSRSHNQEPSSTRKNDHWEETQLIFQNRDKIKEEVDYQKAYAERRARAAAYKEYLAARENPDGNRSPEEAARRTYAEEKVKRKA